MGKNNFTKEIQINLMISMLFEKQCKKTFLHYSFSVLLLNWSSANCPEKPWLLLESRFKNSTINIEMKIKR